MNRYKKVYFTLLIILLTYFFIGLIFTILRSNAHYTYFVINEDSLTKSGKSYWENNCIEQNNANPIPKAQWCVDGLGNFHTETPNRSSWYFILLSKSPVDYGFVLLAWPVEFLGVDLINFRSVGYGW